MQKKATVVIAFTLTLFVLYSAAPALALSTGLYVDPGTITTPGGSTTITLVTPVRAVGTLTVKCDASGEEWRASIDTGVTCIQSWTFPSSDFVGATPPNTNTIGMYNVVAEISMNVGNYVWRTNFMVEFFVIPDLPFGTIMAVVACFGAVAGYTKFKRVPAQH